MKRTSVPGGISLASGLTSFGAFFLFIAIVSDPKNLFGIHVIDQLWFSLLVLIIGCLGGALFGIIGLNINRTEKVSPVVGIIFSVMSCVSIAPLLLLAFFLSIFRAY